MVVPGADRPHAALPARTRRSGRLRRMRPLRPLRPMSAVERFFERLLEQPSARIFRTRVQPVQLEHRIERAMEHGRRIDGRRARVPERMTIRMSPLDLSGIEDPSALTVDLASRALGWARRRGYELSGRPSVAFVADDALGPGNVRVDAVFGDGGAEDHPPGGGVDTRTRVFQPPVIRSVRATILVAEPGMRRRTISAGEAPLMIGRGADNALALADERVSRRHARLAARDGALILTDLESTNGIRVNGARVREIAVGAGDVIEIGDAVLTIVDVDDGDDGFSAAHDGSAGS